jgi:hypothetical protein
VRSQSHLSRSRERDHRHDRLHRGDRYLHGRVSGLNRGASTRMTFILAFDIETVPDIAGLRLLHGIDPQV